MPHTIYTETQTQTLWRIASGFALGEILDELAHRLQAASPGLRAAFLRVERAQPAHPPLLRLCCAPSMGDMYRDYMNGTGLVRGSSPIADVALTGSPIYIQNCETDTRLSPDTRAAYRRFGASCYIAPLLEPRTAAVIGVVCLYPGHTNAPSPEEMRLLSIGAELAGLAIHRENIEKARKNSEAALSASLTALRLQALTDALTGLPNRTQFLQTLSQTLATAQGERLCYPAVLFVDLDRFKMINDTLGHAAGDTLLLQIAARFAKTVGKNDVVARLGGDEFVILLPRTDAATARKVACQIRRVAAEPVLINGQETFVGASVGVALWNPEPAISAEALLQNADVAMYHAKNAGQDGYALYAEAMGDALLERATLEADLRRALSCGELSLVFQPQFDLLTKRMIGAEPQVRWNHPRRGIVPAADFALVAEESGLIEPLGEWLLREACQQAARWQKLPRPLRLAINLSARQFSPRNPVAEQVQRVLAETGFNPALLDIEVTEGVLLAKNVPVSQTLAALKQLGVRLLLDDFGTGYGSLLYLRQFSIDALRLNSSFVRDLSNRDNVAVVRAVIDLAHALGMSVVAEGVETDEQLAELMLMGCDALHGFLLSRPVSGDEIVRLCAEPPPAFAC